MNSPSGWKQLAELLDQHGAALELFAAQWSSSPGDCVQEAFIQLSVYIQQQGQLPEHAAAWLFRVVRNQALNAARAQRRRDHYERIAARLTEQKTPNPSTMGATQMLLESLDELPTAKREVVVLRIWSGLTWQEIADLTGTSSSSAQRAYADALDTLRRKLEQSCLPSIK